MARTNNPAPHAARSASGAATTPAPALVAPAADHSPAAGVLAALAAEPAGATVAVIAEIPDAGRPADDGQPAAEPADGTADAGRSAPVTAHHRGPTGGSRPRAAGPDPAVTAEAAGNVAAIAQAADEAGKALRGREPGRCAGRPGGRLDRHRREHKRSGDPHPHPRPSPSLAGPETTEVPVRCDPDGHVEGPGLAPERRFRSVQAPRKSRFVIALGCWIVWVTSPGRFTGGCGAACAVGLNLMLFVRLASGWVEAQWA